MKKLLIISLALIFSGLTTNAQTKYFTKKGKITFYSKTSMENIDATNSRVASVLEVETGKLEFSVLISAFEFEKALMQEHFNEDYMESKKFPKATFKGAITNMKDVDLKKDGSYAVTITGELLLHGVTKTITEKATILVKGGKISATCDFNVTVKDYQIKAPSKVAEVIQVKINIGQFEPLKK